MELLSLYRAIGVDSCPPEMEAQLSAFTETSIPSCDIHVIDALQAEWNMFGQFHETVKAVAQEINADPYHNAWIGAAATFAKEHSRKEICQIPIPRKSGRLISSLLPLYIIIALLPSGIAKYRSLGFPDPEIQVLMHQVLNSLKISHNQFDMLGINRSYFSWLLLFAKAEIFQISGFQFEIKKLPEAAVYIKNRQTGEIVPLIFNRTIHRSGLHILGSVGFEDSDGAIVTEFREDSENFWGYPCYNCKFHTELTQFPKSQWEAYLRPGQDVLGFHISCHADISPASLQNAFAQAKTILQQRYPDHKSKAFYCSSWLLDPLLGDITGPNSKISMFQNRFLRYPTKCDGNEIFQYVFKRRPDDLTQLPEDTTLRRGLKKCYLSGQYNHSHAGIILE